MRFFGLDLAWADHNPSGVSVLDATGTVLDERLLGSDEEIIDWIDARLAGPAIIAADIPITVPNDSGARVCDRAIASDYGARRAGPHPANRTIFLNRYGRIRGEDLAAGLAGRGFADPWSGSDRILMEVYPHPGIVEVFDLPERLLYKKGPLRQRRHGLARLRTLLASLETTEWPLRGPHHVIPRNATGRELKRIEDLLDARFCAWIAAVWVRGGCRVYGAPGKGHIVVPLRPTSFEPADTR
jgi:predicted RNase H-like nuclease